MGHEKFVQLVERRVAKPRQSDVRREFARLRRKADADQRLLDFVVQPGKLGMVDIKPVGPAAVPVGLKAMRANPELSSLSLLKQSRLSVCAITEKEWAILGQMTGIPADI